MHPMHANRNARTVNSALDPGGRGKGLNTISAGLVTVRAGQATV